VQPLVSILIPACNSGPWIAQTLESALAQTGIRKEIIVVDDGSTDSTVERVRAFAGRGVTLRTQARRGAAAARNHAFQLSGGDYIQWLDSDDLLAPGKIERQVRAIEQSGSDLTLASAAYAHFLYRTSVAKPKPTPLWANLPPVEFLVRAFENNVYMGTPSWLVSRNLALAAGEWDTRLTMDDDGEYFCRVVLASRRVEFVPEARVYYRRRGNSLSALGASRAKMDSQWLSLRLQIEHLLTREDSERTRRAAVRYLQHFVLCFHPERPDLLSQAKELARRLGGELGPPQIARKYALIQRTLGWAAAKQCQARYNALKHGALRFVDRSLLWVEALAARKPSCKKPI